MQEHLRRFQMFLQNGSEGVEDRKNHSSCFQWKIEFPTLTACAFPIQLSTIFTQCRNLSRFRQPKPWHHCNHRMLRTKSQVTNHWYQRQHYELTLQHIKVGLCNPTHSWCQGCLNLMKSQMKRYQLNLKRISFWRTFPGEWKIFIQNRHVKKPHHFEPANVSKANQHLSKHISHFKQQDSAHLCFCTGLWWHYFISV